MNGKSLTAFDGTRWVHFWVDNQAGVQNLKGGAEKDRFTLRSEENIAGFEYSLPWKKQEDGSLLNINQRRKAQVGEIASEWETLYEFVYRKNLNSDLLPDEDE